MIEVEFQGQRLYFVAGEWSGDPLLAHYLDRATGHLLDMERVECGCDISDVEQAIAETTMAYVGGAVVTTREPEPSEA